MPAGRGAIAPPHCEGECNGATRTARCVSGHQDAGPGGSRPIVDRRSALVAQAQRIQTMRLLLMILTVTLGPVCGVGGNARGLGLGGDDNIGDQISSLDTLVRAAVNVAMVAERAITTRLIKEAFGIHQGQLDSLAEQLAKQQKLTDSMQAKPTQPKTTAATEAGEGLTFEAARGQAQRRMQTSAPDPCVSQAAAVTVACCADAGGGQHRLLQDGGCDPLPSACSETCAPVFIAFREECSQIFESAGFAAQQVERLHASCLEQMGGEGSCGARLGRRLQRVASSQDSFGSATQAMIIPLTIVTNERTGLLEVLAQTGRRRSLQQGAEAVQQFRCQCGGSNIASCIPECGEEIHGYELLLTIDNSDLRVSCKLHLGIFSWAGAVSEGSYFGQDHKLFLTMLVSGAEGRYALELVGSVTAVEAGQLGAGQSAILRSASEHPLPVWLYTGDGAAFVVAAEADLDIRQVVVAADSGLAFRLESGGGLVSTALKLQRGDMSLILLLCSALAAGIGQSAVACVDTGPGGVQLSGPLVISVSGAGFGIGSTKYIGNDRGAFEEAISAGAAGLYTFQMAHIETVTLPLPVGGAMHVTIAGDTTMPAWGFSARTAFTVAVQGHLNLMMLTIQPAVNSLVTISIEEGGEVNCQHAVFAGGELHVSGSLAIEDSTMDDVVLTSTTTSIIGIQSTTVQTPFTWPINGHAQIGPESACSQLRLALGVGSTLDVVSTTFEGETVFDLSSGSEISFLDSHMTLQGTGGLEPLPCDGIGVHCDQPHIGVVTLVGPTQINSQAPLVCNGEECNAGRDSVSSCLLDLGSMDSCYVHLPQVEPSLQTLTTVTIRSNKELAVHGTPTAPVQDVDLAADWRVLAHATLRIIAARLLGGGLDAFASTVRGSDISVDGSARLEQVQINIGVIQVAGDLAISGSALDDTPVTCTDSGAVLQISGQSILSGCPVICQGSMEIGSSQFLASPVTVAAQGHLEAQGSEFIMASGQPMAVSVQRDGVAEIDGSTFQEFAVEHYTPGLVSHAIVLLSGAQLTISGSELTGDMLDPSAESIPLPCDSESTTNCSNPLGAAMSHSGAVSSTGPLAISVASPLVCPTDVGGQARACVAAGSVVSDLGSCAQIFAVQETATCVIRLAEAPPGFQVLRCPPRYTYCMGFCDKNSDCIGDNNCPYTGSGPCIVAPTLVSNEINVFDGQSLEVHGNGPLSTPFTLSVHLYPGGSLLLDNLQLQPDSAVVIHGYTASLTVRAMAMPFVELDFGSCKTCDELGWAVTSGAAGVCAEVGLSHNQFFPGLSSCATHATLSEAEALCTGVGARLCSAAEIISGAHGDSHYCNTASNHYYMWTSSTGHNDASCDDADGAARFLTGNPYVVYKNTYETTQVAEEICVRAGGHLASVHNEAEWQLLVAAVLAADLGSITAETPHVVELPLTLGGYENANEGQWEWTDGSHFDTSTVMSGFGGATQTIIDGDGAGRQNWETDVLRYCTGMCAHRYSFTEGLHDWGQIGSTDGYPFVCRIEDARRVPPAAIRQRLVAYTEANGHLHQECRSEIETARVNCCADTQCAALPPGSEWRPNSMQLYGVSSRDHTFTDIHVSFDFSVEGELRQAATPNTGHSTSTGTPNLQCLLPYAEVSEAARSIGNWAPPAQGSRFYGEPKWCDCDDEWGAYGGWKRFTAGAGNVMATHPASDDRTRWCGFNWYGWLSGWSPSEAVAHGQPLPDHTYRTPGTLPTSPNDGVVRRWVCFDVANPYGPCYGPLEIAVVHCGSFMLFRLPKTWAGSDGTKQGGYCSDTAQAGVLSAPNFG